MEPLLLIPAIYLLSAAIGKQAGNVVPAAHPILFTSAFIIAAFLMGRFPEGHAVTYPWFHAGEFDFQISLGTEGITSITLVFASLIAALVAIYSTWYFRGDAHLPRAQSTLSLFMLSMYGLLVSSNLVLTFFCWELVGLSSYLLIGYYRTSSDAGPASTKAMVMNKIGDAGFLVALMAIGSQTVNFGSQHLEQAIPGFDGTVALIAGTGLLIAALAKSAQFPFHSWLPDAMAGPTPVSALIHSATMVAAGVFLLVRWKFLFPTEVGTVAGVLGMATMLLGGWNALSQTGLKRLLAWSTISQLGLMIMAAGIGNSDAALLHLMTHGIFKAGLFLLAGIFLSGLHHHAGEQTSHELEAIGEKGSTGKTISIALLLLSTGLTGMPLSAAYISKEGILSSLPGYAVAAWFAGSLLTLLYTARLLWYLRPFSSGSTSTDNIAIIPVVILSVMSLWILVAPFPLSSVTWNGMQLPHNGTLTLLATGWVVSIALILWMTRSKGWIAAVEHHAPAINVDPLYRMLFIRPVRSLGSLVKYLDRQVIDRALHGIGYLTVACARITGWADRTLVDGVVTLTARTAEWTGTTIRRTASGNVSGYLWWTAAGLIILLTCLS